MDPPALNPDRRMPFRLSDYENGAEVREDVAAGADPLP